MENEYITVYTADGQVHSVLVREGSWKCEHEWEMEAPVLEFITKRCVKCGDIYSKYDDDDRWFRINP